VADSSASMASWLSLHAPRRFDELAIPETVSNTLCRASLSGSPPHILLTGPAGVGKTAAWRLVARQVLGPSWESTCHVLQARDLARQSGAMRKFEDFLRPAGIGSKDTLASRTSLEAFDRGMWETKQGDAPAGEETIPAEGMASVSRLIVIEDADHLGMKRQPYLRRMMEAESLTTRFIFTARAPSRIIDALRSRMTHIRIPATAPADTVQVLERVAAAEQVEVAPGIIADIAHVADGNLRRALFTFEMLARRGLAGERGKLFEVVSASSLTAAREMVEMALRGRVIEWRWEKERGRNVRRLEGAMGKLDEMEGNHALDAEDIIHQVHAELIGSRLMLAVPLRQELLAALSHCDVAIRRSMHNRIQLEHFLHKVADAGKKHGLALA